MDWHPSFAIDPTAQISRLADLEPSVRGSRLVVGPRSSIDAFVKIKFAGGNGDIVIGADCRINSSCVIYGGHGVTLGDEVLVAAGCIFVPANHAVADVSRSIRVQGHLPSKAASSSRTTSGSARTASSSTARSSGAAPSSTRLGRVRRDCPL